MTPVSFAGMGHFARMLAAELLVDRMYEVLVLGERLEVPYICGNCRSYFVDHPDLFRCLFRPTGYREATPQELSEIYLELSRD